VPPGDGWAHCARGHRHWGLFGAAGLLLRHRSPDGVDWLLMQHRASWSHHGDTWGLLGGARMPGETAEQAAEREACEEAGLPGSSYTVLGSYTDDHGGWSYVTVLAEAPSLVPARATTAESTAVAWMRLEELDGLPLHPGFAGTWSAVAAELLG
jgi:8-oxo-dGTP pyrophosphatase MutT (NUDIX family)